VCKFLLVFHCNYVYVVYHSEIQRRLMEELLYDAERDRLAIAVSCFIHDLHLMPPLGVILSEFAQMFSIAKTRMVVLAYAQQSMMC